MIDPSTRPARVEAATSTDFTSWLDLAGQVEPLFGPMVGEGPFRRALKHALDDERAFCVRETQACPGSRLCGGIIISRDENRIEWLAVASDSRGRGLGKALLRFAIERLDSRRDIRVQTFAPGIPEGAAARGLYLSLGFRNDAPAEPTPAGIATALMVRPAAYETHDSS
jgi:ribosomal protein S18 acetylase RimI-like enzyme